MTTIRFFAAAATAAGIAQLSTDIEHSTDSLTETVLRALESNGGELEELQALLPICSFLVDGHYQSADQAVGTPRTIDVLPPFAGG